MDKEHKRTIRENINSQETHERMVKSARNWKPLSSYGCQSCPIRLILKCIIAIQSISQSTWEISISRYSSKSAIRIETQCWWCTWPFDLALRLWPLDQSHQWRRMSAPSHISSVRICMSTLPQMLQTHPPRRPTQEVEPRVVFKKDLWACWCTLAIPVPWKARAGGPNTCLDDRISSGPAWTPMEVGLEM